MIFVVFFYYFLEYTAKFIHFANFSQSFYIAFRVCLKCGSIIKLMEQNLFGVEVE